MIWVAFLIAVQAPPSWQDDPLAHEVLDYRGRRDACSYTPDGDLQWRLWHCNRVAEDEALLRAKLKSRPELLARLDTPLNAKEKYLIVSGDERHSAELERVTQVGTIGNDRKIRVSVTSKANHLGEITIEEAGQLPLILRIGETIDYPDLSSVRVSWFRGDVDVELDFGVPQPWCFALQDGRSKLAIVVERGKPRAVRQDTVKCTLVSRPVVLKSN